MTIENKIRWTYNRYQNRRYKDIINYPWDRMPESIRWNCKECLKGKESGIRGHIIYIQYIQDELIRRADEVECLTSASRYIRECKKWYMENK